MLQITEQYLDWQSQRIYLKTWQPTQASTLAPIVLLHESLGSTQQWKAFPEQLANACQRTVISYDRLGFAKSSPLQGVPELTFIQAETPILLALVQALGLTQVVLYGHSVGGAMAACFAAQYPNICQALILEAAQSHVEPQTLAGIQQAKTFFSAPNNLERLAKYHHQQAQWVLDAWTETWLDPAFAKWDLSQQLDTIQVPSLILFGSTDQYGSLAQAQGYQELCSHPDSKLCVLPEVGHFPHKTATPQVLTAVSQFLTAQQ